jgi:two-component system, NarL family, response regulator DegU
MESLKVYVADDHTLFRKAFVRIIRDCKKIKEIKEASNGLELLDLVRQELPDVVIVDIEMPVMGGIKTCRKLTALYPEIKIIVLSMHDEVLQIYQALQSGARAFLSKVASLEEFEMAMNCVLDGKVYSNALMEEALLYGNALNGVSKDLPETLPDFSRRELAIISLICKQLTNRQIGLELLISEHTVRNHKVRIMRKAKVKNVQGLVRFAVARGLFSE